MPKLNRCPNCHHTYTSMHHAVRCSHKKRGEWRASHRRTGGSSSRPRRRPHPGDFPFGWSGGDRIQVNTDALPENKPTSRKVQQITPDPDCKFCHGTGYVTDWVPMPFGHGNTAMESYCGCVEAQAFPDTEDIEVVTPEAVKLCTDS